VVVASRIQQYWQPLPCHIAIVSVAMFPSPKNNQLVFVLGEMKQSTCSIVGSAAVVAMSCSSGKLFAALCVVHGCTHTTSWLIVSFLWGEGQGRQQNATATMAKLIVLPFRTRSMQVNCGFVVLVTRQQNATATMATATCVLFFAPIMPLIVLLFHFIFTPPVI